MFDHFWELPLDASPCQVPAVPEDLACIQFWQPFAVAQVYGDVIWHNVWTEKDITVHRVHRFLFFKKLIIAALKRYFVLRSFNFGFGTLWTRTFCLVTGGPVGEETSSWSLT